MYSGGVTTIFTELAQMFLEGFKYVWRMILQILAILDSDEVRIVIEGNI